MIHQIIYIKNISFEHIKNFIYEPKKPMPMVKKEKKSKTGVIMAALIAFIMVGSILGYVSMDRQTQYKYNDVKFKQEQIGWSTVINNKKIVFNYLPQEVEQIELSPEVINALKDKPEIDVTSKVNDTFSEEIALAQYTLAQTLNNFNVYIMQGFTTNSTFKMPIITCKDATQAVPVIYFQKSNETKVTLQENCIIAEARNNLDIIRIKDRLIYSILNIIQ